MTISVLALGLIPLPTLLSPGYVEIQVTKPVNMVAPAQIWLKAINISGLADIVGTGSVYEGTHHEYYYEWTIRGEPLSVWTKPVNLIDEHNDPNKAFGREVAILLPDADNYIFDLVVTDRNGKMAFASTSSYTVNTPESYYADTDRIYVDSTATYTDVPASSTKVSSLTDLVSALESRNVEKTWVLFRCGDTYDMSDVDPTNGTANSRCTIRLNSLRKCSRLSSYGSGDKPKFIPSDVPDIPRPNVFTIAECAADFITITGLHIDFNWDTEIERGNLNGSGIGCDVDNEDLFVLIHNLTVNGTQTGISFGGTVNSYQMVADCELTDWRDYGLYCAKDLPVKIAILGNRLVQNPLARGGPNNGNKDILNAHTPTRLSGGLFAYIAMNDYFNSNVGWTSHPQPCLRLFVEGDTVGQVGYVERNCMEGGYEVIMIEDSNGKVDVPLNVVVERNFLLATAAWHGPMVSIWRSGVTVRLNIFIVDNILRLPTLTEAYAIKCTEEGTQGTGNTTNSVHVYENTYVNRISSANTNGRFYPFFDADVAFTQTIEKNNIVHVPDIATTTITTFAPIDLTTTIAEITPRYVGSYGGFKTVAISSYLTSSVADSATFTVPYSAIGQDLTFGGSLGGATDQTYWNTISGTDTRHTLWLDSQARYLHAELGHFTVSFGATEVTITNTSGFTWSAQAGQLNLDRTTNLPTLDTSYASPSTVFLPRPQTGSIAIGSAESGWTSPKDFLLAARTTSTKGALEPAA